MCRFTVPSQLAACFLSIALAAPAFAGISIVDQSRTVSTAGPSINQTDTATPSAPFSDTLSKSGSVTPMGQPLVSFQASASQNSTIDLTGSTLNISATGSASFSITGGTLITLGGAGQVEGQSNFSVTFLLSSPAMYTVVEQTDHQTQPSPNEDLEASSQGAQLLSGTKNLIPFPFFNVKSTAPQTFSGTLAAGKYTFGGGANAFDIEASSGSANFTENLTVSASSGSGTGTGGNGGSPVPVPNAAWMGLATLPVLLVGMSLARRRFCT